MHPYPNKSGSLLHHLFISRKKVNECTDGGGISAKQMQTNDDNRRTNVQVILLTFPNLYLGITQTLATITNGKTTNYVCTPLHLPRFIAHKNYDLMVVHHCTLYVGMGMIMFSTYCLNRVSSVNHVVQHIMKKYFKWRFMLENDAFYDLFKREYFNLSVICRCVQIYIKLSYDYWTLLLSHLLQLE